MERKALPTTKTNYFVQAKKEGLEYIHSGSTLLDCVVGGGWPLGRMSNIVGDRSTGKCAVNSAIILTKNGFVDLEQIHYKFPMGTSLWEQSAVISKGNYDTISHFYKEECETYISLITRHGYSIDVTPNHPILIWTPDCKTVMKRAHTIEVGDIAVIAKATHCYGNDQTVNENLAFVLGALVADGINPKHGRIDISTTRSYLKDLVVKSLINLKVKPFERDCNVGTNNKELTEKVWSLFSNPLEFTARNKFVPNCILQASFNIQQQFLIALIDCDSYYDSRTGALSYYTASVKLAKQVHLMLLNMGIASSLIPKQGAAIGEKYYNHTYWSININGRYTNLYANLIGSNKYELRDNCESKSDFDYIPFLLDKMIEDRNKVKRHLGWLKNGKLMDGTRFVRFNYRNYKNSGWNLLHKFIELHEPYSNCGIDIGWYKDLENSQFHFDPIVSTEIITTKTTSYDVHVPQHHKFWCNGFISHNTLLAIEACANFKHTYPDGQIIYLEAEAAFDQEYAEALGMPIDNIQFIGDELKDFTVESWFEHLNDILLPQLLKSEKPCLYIVDSLDALSDRSERDREIDKGSYGANKPKVIGQLFRRLIKDIEKTRTHLMIISQIRDNIGVMFGEKHTRTGGKALDFYASQILWLAQLKKLEKTIKKVKRIYGIQVKANCKKNKIGLPFRDCEFPILFGYGIDDISSMLNWIISINEEDTIISVLGGELYAKAKDAQTLSELIKALEPIQRKEIISKLSLETIRLWQEIEMKFIPKVSKY